MCEYVKQDERPTELVGSPPSSPPRAVGFPASYRMNIYPRPSMEEWEAAWRSADSTRLQACYAPDASVIPPNHALLSSPAAIVAYLASGMEQVTVRFRPTTQRIADTLAWEVGVVTDMELGTDNVVETCHYTVTWIWQDDRWLIQAHTWTIGW